MLTELDLYQQDRSIYDNRRVCQDLEPNFSHVFEMMRNGETTLTEDGQIVWNIGARDRVLAGFFTAQVSWSDEARMLIPEDMPSETFEAVVLVKNPGRVNRGIYSEATTGAVNAMVMVGDTLWCAAMENGRSEKMQLVRRVTDLTGAEMDYQGILGQAFQQLVTHHTFVLQPWKPVSKTW